MERVRRGTTKSATACGCKREPPEKQYDEDAGMYYFNARWYDAEIGRFVTQDPARDGMNWYAYCLNNPLKYIDPDGHFVETAWDVVSLATGVVSLVADVRAGNVKGAIIDGLGIVADAAAVALPGIPGGVGTALKAAGAAANVAGGALSIQDGLENCDYFEVSAGILQAVSGFGEAKALADASKVSNAVDSAKASHKTAEGFDNWLNKGEANNQVYFGMKGDEAVYTGITKQTPDARLKQHNANGKGFTDLKVRESGLTRNKARAIEQYYIENGPNELNEINSISPNNKYYNDAMNWAKNYFGE